MKLRELGKKYAEAIAESERLQNVIVDALYAEALKSKALKAEALKLEWPIKVLRLDNGVVLRFEDTSSGMKYDKKHIEVFVRLSNHSQAVVFAQRTSVAPGSTEDRRGKCEELFIHSVELDEVFSFINMKLAGIVKLL